MPTYDFEHKVEMTMRAIEESDEIHPDNRERLQEWKRDLTLGDLSMATIQKRTAHMKVVAEHVGDTRFLELDKADMKDLIEWVQSRGKAPSTEEGYKKIIRFFWKWLYEHEGIEWDPRDDYPEVVGWIEPNSHVSSQKLPTDLLTKEDIDAQIEQAHNTRDEAIIATLYETGARIGEFIDLTIGDLQDREGDGWKVVLDGKTGQRQVPVVESERYVNRWLSDHPTGHPEDPLWSKIHSPEPISYNYIRLKVLKATANRAARDDPEAFAVSPSATDDDDREVAFHKPVNPHHYRHSRASFLANKLTEAQMCEWFGWVQGSDEVAKYVHLSERDLDDAIRDLYGESPLAQPIDHSQPECPRCGEEGRAGAKWCDRCGRSLEEEQPLATTATPQDEALARLLAALLGVEREQLEDPEVLEAAIEQIGPMSPLADVDIAEIQPS